MHGLRPALFALGLSLALLPMSAHATDSPQIGYKLNLAFDQAGTSYADDGVAAIALPDGRTVAVGQVDIAVADTRIVGIGLARRMADGSADTSFATYGKRVKDAYLTSVVGACRGTDGEIVVAGTTPQPGSSTLMDVGVVSFNANGSDNTVFAGDGGTGWHAQLNLGYSVNGVACGDGGQVLVFGSERWGSYTYAMAVLFGPNGSVIGSQSIASSAYNDDYTAAFWNASRGRWLLARRSSYPGDVRQVVIEERSSLLTSVSSPWIASPPAACGGARRVGGMLKALDGSMVATVGTNAGAALWRFDPAATSPTQTCSTVPSLYQEVRAPARLNDGRIGVIDGISNLQNDGANARMVVMKPYGYGYIADTAVNGDGRIFWLHTTFNDVYNTTFAKSIASHGTHFVVAGSKNYRDPDRDVALTKITP